MEKEQQIEDEFFGNCWVSPKLVVPANKEIIVIAVTLEDGSQIMETAVYEQREDGREAWHCGQPFATLLYWHSLKNFDALARTLEEAKPQPAEVVVLCCTAQNGDVFFQTAIYWVDEAGADQWAYGQAFEKLNRWYSLPAIPDKAILLPKMGLIQ